MTDPDISRVDYTLLRTMLDSATYVNHGDGHEKNAGPALSVVFPNCERLWGLFIVPMTLRLNGYPDKLSVDGSDYIRWRTKTDDRIRDLASTHYTMFSHLVYSLPPNMRQNDFLWIEDHFAHLSSACDSANQFLFKLLKLMFPDEFESATAITSEDLAITGLKQYLEKDYKKQLEKHLQDGRTVALRFHDQAKVISLLIPKLIHSKSELKEYRDQESTLRQYRNLFVHNMLLGRIETEDGTTRIPIREHLNNYVTWDAVWLASENDKRNNFRPAREIIEQMSMNLCQRLDVLWARIVDALAEDFYHPETSVLRPLYGIEFLKRG